MNLNCFKIEFNDEKNEEIDKIKKENENTQTSLLSLLNKEVSLLNEEVSKDIEELSKDIEELSIEELDEELLTNNSNELISYFFDSSNKIENRIYALSKLYNIDYEKSRDTLDKIKSLFYFTPKYYENILIEVVLNSDLDYNMKLECCNLLYENSKEIGYKVYNTFLKDIYNFPLVLQFKILSILMQTDKYYDNTLKYLLKITNITDKKDIDKNIIIYKHMYDLTKDKNILEKYLKECFTHFIRNENNLTRYRILACQYILTSLKTKYIENLKNVNIEKYKLNVYNLISIKKSNSTVEEGRLLNEIENLIISFCLDNNLDYNVRADAADLLIRECSEKGIEIGKDIITLLGRQNNFTTVYTNNQNVHNEEVDKSIMDFVKNLLSVESNMTYEEIEKEILENINQDYKENEIKKVKSSLLRITIDSSLYLGQRIHLYFIKIYKLIIDHKHKHELKKRLIEELIDMADTCSTGHLSRLVNIFSGFEINNCVFNINIGWEQQIYSNLVARLTSKIKSIEDEDLKGDILNDLITSGSLLEKKYLSKFFRENLLNIRDQLYKEFVSQGYVKDDKFEEYIRNSIHKFEESS